MYKIWDKYLKKNMSCNFAMKNWHLLCHFKASS